ncbi:MAG: hypothetical protein IJS01_14080 [Lentisphaeria bacterium]|nr:hypothetical protein [Lentisphaeria bacterium]
MSDLQNARARLFERSCKLHKTLRVELGETASPGYRERCALEDPERKPLSEEYWKQLFPEYAAFAEAVRQELAAKPAFDRGRPVTSDDLWLWGGPTPEWGGSLLPDTLLRTAKYFNAVNGVYVYGPTSREMISRHGGMKKLLAMVTTTCRAPGQQPESDVECAEKLSRLSLEFPCVAGGMMDDMTAASDAVTPEKIRQVSSVSAALKKHNPALELFGVVYRHELGKKDYSGILPYIDGVNLWHWYQEELLDLEENVSLCRTIFPGKKILMGLFLHDYGTSDAGTLPELLLYQLQGARSLLARGEISGLVILGDREILKWPEQAAAVKGFLEAR